MDRAIDHSGWWCQPYWGYRQASVPSNWLYCWNVQVKVMSGHQQWITTVELSKSVFSHKQRSWESIGKQ